MLARLSYTRAKYVFLNFLQISLFFPTLVLLFGVALCLLFDLPCVVALLILVAALIQVDGGVVEVGKNGHEELLDKVVVEALWMEWALEWFQSLGKPRKN